MAAVVPQPGISFQERDLALLRGLFESRVMTLKHVSALYFEGTGRSRKEAVAKAQSGGLRQ
jgi:hypothetical protein